MVVDIEMNLNEFASTFISLYSYIFLCVYPLFTISLSSAFLSVLPQPCMPEDGLPRMPARVHGYARVVDEGMPGHSALVMGSLSAPVFGLGMDS